MADTETPPQELDAALRRLANEGSLLLKDAYTLAEKFGCSLSMVEECALENDIFPHRYIRNRHTLDAKAQLRLMQSHVLLVGCGGIGGFVAQFLAQTGVGKITFYDADHFEESNLNRQNFCNIDTLGNPKVEICANRLLEINPAMQAVSNIKMLKKTDLTKLQSIDILIETSDDPQSKRELSKACQSLKIDFLHTALAGESFLLSLNMVLDTYYVDSERGAEVWTGNLATTASAVAAVASSQIVRLLAGKDSLLHEGMFMVDLATLESSMIPFP